MADIRLARPKFTHRLASAGSDRCGWLKSSACSQDVALRAQRSFAPEALHLLHSYYDLMCQSRSLLPASLCRLAGQSSQLGPPTAGLRHLPDVTCARIFPRMPGPIPRQPLGCFCPFLPPEHRPSLKRYQVGAQQIPTQRLPHGEPFRSYSHSFMFKPPGLLATQIVPTAATSWQGGRGVYFRAPHELLPPHTSDMLAVRFRAIDGRGLSPH